MVAAGETIVAGRIPGERMATSVRTSTVGSITGTEVLVDQISTLLVEERTYRLTWHGPVRVTATGTNVRVFLRSDVVGGNQLQLDNIQPPVQNLEYRMTLEAEFRPVVTSEFTLLASMIRIGGTGTISSVASSGQPTYLYIDYIRG